MIGLARRFCSCVCSGQSFSGFCAAISDRCLQVAEVVLVRWQVKAGMNVNGKEVVYDTVQGCDMGLVVLQGNFHEYLECVGLMGSETNETGPAAKVYFRVEEGECNLDSYARVHLDNPMYGDVFPLIICRQMIELVLYRSNWLTNASVSILQKAMVTGALDAQELFKQIRVKVIQLCGKMSGSSFVNIPRAVMQDRSELAEDDPSYVKFEALFEKLRSQEKLGYNELGFLLQYASGLANDTGNTVGLQYALLEEFFVYAPGLPRAFHPVTDTLGIMDPVGMPFALPQICSFSPFKDVTPLVRVIGDGRDFSFCVCSSMWNYNDFKEAFSYTEPVTGEDMSEDDP